MALASSHPVEAGARLEVCNPGKSPQGRIGPRAEEATGACGVTRREEGES